MAQQLKSMSKTVTAAKERGPSEGAKRVAENPEFAKFLREQVESTVIRAVENTLSTYREVFLHQVKARLRERLDQQLPEQHSVPEGSEWCGIESLSRLRSVVGGRFQNIKKKWVDAGFPLREHRGDRVASFEVDQNGWLDLSNWILKQGYEVRLAEGGEFLFEIRALNK